MRVGREQGMLPEQASRRLPSGATPSGGGRGDEPAASGAGLRGGGGGRAQGPAAEATVWGGEGRQLGGGVGSPSSRADPISAAAVSSGRAWQFSI